MSTVSSHLEPASEFAEVPFLVVEDDPPSARLLATVLATEGATHVRIAHTADQARAVLRDEFVRVLIVDVVLPGMSGLVLVRDVKTDDATRHIIAVAVSCWDGDGLTANAIASGCVALLPKPIAFDRLLAILRRNLAQPASGILEAGVTKGDA